VTATLEALGLIGSAEKAALAQHAGDRLRNFAGLEVGAVRGVVRLRRKETV
jgi:hypothetical protein